MMTTATRVQRDNHPGYGASPRTASGV